MSAVSRAPGVVARRRSLRGLPARPVPRLVRRQLADSRRRTLTFGFLFAGVAYLQPVAYRHTYPTIFDRRQFAHSFGTDKAIRLFYGVPHDLLTVGGYTSWRIGEVLAVMAGVWAILAAAGAMRGEEDRGRAETVFAQPITRLSAAEATLAAIAFQAAALLVLLLVGLVAAGLAAAPSAFLALSIGSVIPVFAGIGALASQLAGTRRRAVELAVACLGLAFAVRVVADTVTGVAWLRWLTPLGWVEQLRAFAGPQPAVLLLPALTGGVLLIAATRISIRRDVGTALLGAADSRPARRFGLRSPSGFALRGEAVALTAWLVGIGSFALIIGMIAKSVSGAGITPRLRRVLAHAGAGSVSTPIGYLGFVFLIFALALSLFACSQIAAARAEEVEGRLETMLAATLGRARWLVSRLAVTVAAAAILAVAAAVLAWAGARAAGVDVTVGPLLLAGANCFAAATLFAGVGALAYALTPRAGAAIAYALVTAAFLWQLFGAVLGAPVWLVDLSPFVHFGLTPARAFRPGPVAVMVVIGVAAGAAAVATLVRRDVLSTD